MRRQPAALLVSLCLGLGLPTVAGETAPAGAAWGRKPFSDVAYWAGILEDPARDDWQMPLHVLDFLGIRPGESVADLGAGTGYFTRFLSFPVGSNGRVYAVDTERRMVEHLEAMEHTNRAQIKPVLARPDDPKLPAGEIDLVFMANTWHQIKKRPAYLRRLIECLSPEGRVVVIDFRDGDLPVGPPARKRVGREQVLREFEEQGFRFVAESVALPYQYFLTFLPPPRDIVQPVPTSTSPVE